MAKAAALREWAQQNGRPQTRGALPVSLISDWDAEHPDDPYEPGGRAAGLMGPDEMDGLFGDEPVGGPPAAPDGLPETRPQRVPAARANGKNGFLGSLGIGGGKPKGGAGKGKKPPRISTEDLLGSLWRGAAKLAAPLPPLHRTLRVQAPVAGVLLEDAVKGTVADTVLQPLARAAERGKAVSALVGPPMLVAGITIHAQQRAAQGLAPNPVFMALAQEGLRSSLMTWMDVAGPKFADAIAREREFEAKYGADVDQFMEWLFAPPPATAEEAEQEEAMYARAMGADERAAA